MQCFTFLTLLVSVCVLGVRRETFNTTTQFITVIAVTDITNIKYLIKTNKKYFI